MKKHSLTIDGHRTSLTLEDPFWQALQEIAARQQCSIQTLVQRIDKKRLQGLDGLAPNNLCSAVRVTVLRFYQNELAKQKLP